MTRLLDLGEGDPVPPTADWDRIRFRTWSEDDPRPVKFPPPGPYWVTGTAYDPAGDYAILVAYFPAGNREAVKDFWPDTDLDAWDGFSIQHDQPIEFSGRFPQPKWWTASVPARP